MSIDSNMGAEEVAGLPAEDSSHISEMSGMTSSTDPGQESGDALDAAAGADATGVVSTDETSMDSPSESYSETDGYTGWDDGSSTDPQSDGSGADSLESLAPQAEAYIMGYSDVDWDGTMESAVLDLNADGAMDGRISDTDGNGVGDLLVLDADGDGWIDTTASDANEDGVADSIAIDINHDLEYDAMVVDENTDGNFETVLADSNLDGHLDSMLTDSNLDGSYETFTMDTNDDGLVDVEAHLNEGPNVESVSQFGLPGITQLPDTGMDDGYGS